MRKAFLALMAPALLACFPLAQSACRDAALLYAEDYTYSLGADGFLRTATDEEGSFAASYSGGNLAGTITASEDGCVLRYVDERGRMVEEVCWGKDLAKIEKSISYQYTPEQSTPKEVVWRYPLEERLVTARYNAKGLVEEESCYRVALGSVLLGADSGKLPEIIARAAPLSQNVYKYDADGRLTEERTVSFGAGGAKNTVLKRYTWTNRATEPDSEQYEDGVLVLRRSYTSDSDYNERLYFEDGFEMYTEYSSGARTLEVLYIDGTEVRRESW